jgi:cellulose synthase operon protein C
MVGRTCSWGVVAACLGLGAGFTAATARGDEDARNAAEFIQGLRERGYYELATDYLEQVRKQPDAPAELVLTADYEVGRMLLDEASKTGDLARRRDLLDQARGKLDAFTKANPKHPKAPEALVELARLLVERGHLAMLQADDTELKAEKEGKLAEARGSFDQARAAYTAAETQLSTSFAKYPKFIPNDDPRHDEKERNHTALMQARLQKAVVDYEQGQTYPPGSKERTELLSKGLVQFEDIYKKYRTQLAGLTARMWQGKCYEEQGELGKAMGVYNELMEHGAPQLRPLQRYVGYFRIIVMGKRKEYALAADESVRWLQANRSPEALRSKDGLGVQLELAKNIIAQLPGATNEKEKTEAIKKVVDVLGNVVRYSSPYKAEAIALLKKYKPNAAANATDVARLNYDDALAEGEQALAAHEWERAGPLLKQAIRRAEAVKDIDKINYVRYNLSFCYYMEKRYYEAVVIADHLARRYPRAGLSAKAAELGMASLFDAYNTYTQVDRATDLNNLIELATYTAEAYPEIEQGDAARLILGQIHHGTGKYDKAIEAFQAIRPKSSKYLEGQTRMGGSYWKKSQLLRRDGKIAEADAAQNQAVATLQSALKARSDLGNPPGDPALIGNACDLADIYLEISKPDEAVKLLEPLAKAQTSPSGATFARLTADLLRAHIDTYRIDLAMADMAALEKAGGSAAEPTQLYLSLGKLLEKEMDALKKKGDSAGLNRASAAFLKFLTALAQSKSGQTYESLEWVGENMLTLGKPKEAEAVFHQILKTYENDPKFKAVTGSGEAILRTRLKLSAALRGERNFGEAESLVSQILHDLPSKIEPLMERGMLFEDEAAAGKGTWSAAFRHWQSLALRLANARPRPSAYYDAWYHAALALKNDKKPTEAKQTLALVMRLSPTLGGLDMKKKYKELLDQIK